jgi:imidazolonepropionase-like amidohydrolase
MRVPRLSRCSPWLLMAVLAVAGPHGCAWRVGQPFALAPGDLWIRNVTVISMERDRPVPNAHVVIRAGRIVWVGATPASIDGITALDGTGRYLVPGLIDGHVHLDAPLPGMSNAQRAAMPELVQAFEEELPRSYLYFGFTTVVDLGVTDPAALARIRAAPLAPRVLDCGAPLVIANGYPMILRPAPERFDRYPNFLYDPRQADSIPARFSAAAHSPEAAVNRIRAGGGICIKAFYELGDPDHPWPVPTEAMIRDARDAGRRARLPLLLHANSLAAHQFAAAVAPAAVAHGLWFWPGLLRPTGRADTLPAAVRNVLDAERAAGVAYMPTLRVIAGLVDLADSTFLDSPQLARVVPPLLLAWYRSDAGRQIALESNSHGAMHELLRSASGLGTRALAYVSRRGGRIVFGSDTPAGSVYTNPPGYNGYLELRAMQAGGLTPRQVLAAATLENARLFGVDAQMGTIEVGKAADLLLLDVDPLVSTAAFDAIRAVILAGRVVPREKLAAPGGTR